MLGGGYVDQRCMKQLLLLCVHDELVPKTKNLCIGFHHQISIRGVICRLRHLFFNKLVFPKIGVPQNGWKTYGKPYYIKWMIWGENPLFSETSTKPPRKKNEPSPLNTPLGHSQWLVCYDCLFAKGLAPNFIKQTLELFAAMNGGKFGVFFRQGLCRANYPGTWVP